MDAGPLLVRYDLSALHGTAQRDSMLAQAAAAHGMWRYAAVLPAATPVSLGEGSTPLLASRRHANVWVKDEGTNPAGSMAARGMSLAVTMARQQGLRHLAVASAGDAASALAAYAAAAGIAAHVWLPQNAPLADYAQCALYGADVHSVEGTVSDCERKMHEAIAKQRANGAGAEDLWFDVSALREPFRIEGAKTLAYELVEQFGWEYPDAVVYPSADATGLIGINKAFDELEQLAWVSGKRPRIYTAQPMAEIASEIVRQSGGAVVSVSDEEVTASLRDYAANEGLFLSLQGAAGTAAYAKLLASGAIQARERVVLCNPGSGLKDADSIAKTTRLRRSETLPKSLPVGGIITPV
jgi:threonine synthase